MENSSCVENAMKESAMSDMTLKQKLNTANKKSDAEYIDALEAKIAEQDKIIEDLNKEAQKYREYIKRTWKKMDRNSADLHNERYTIGELECYEVIQKLLEAKPFLTGYQAWLYATAFKYSWRMGNKDDMKREIRKRINYLELLEKDITEKEMEETTCRT